MARRLAIFGALALMLCASVPAAAHPLGNFTINHLSELSGGRDRVALRYVLDMAEIPTFALMREHDASGKMTKAELAAWAASEAKAVTPQLDLRFAGAPQALEIVRTQAHTRPGAGGLPTLYWVADFTASLPANATGTLTFADRTFAGRLGWKDVVVAPATEPTRELTAYPNALLGSPRNSV